MIRTAAGADAAALARIQHRAWWRAYSDFVDPERFGTLEARVARWHEHLAPSADPRRTTLVFDQDGQRAGFIAVGPMRGDDAGDTVAAAGHGEPRALGELTALYVDPPVQGAGVGRALLAAGVELLREEGYAEAVLWVFAANEAARSFYVRSGWRLEAGSTRDDAWAREVRYRLPLTAN